MTRIRRLFSNRVHASVPLLHTWRGGQGVRFFILLLLLVSAACQPAGSDALPTLIDLNALATQTAAAITPDANVPTITPTPTTIPTRITPATLPPAWTAAPTVAQTTALPVTPAQQQINATGTIFYIYNSDSIAMLDVASASEELILATGSPGSLRVAPDERSLAYVAQGSGSARELYVMSRTNFDCVQAITSLGQARLIAPAWSADSKRLAFAASQTTTGRLSIYTVEQIGIGDCPAWGNVQRVADTDFDIVLDIAWNPDATRLVFSSGLIYGVDLGERRLLGPLTSPGGFGPDYGSVFYPGSNTVYFLRTDTDLNSSDVGGRLAYFDFSVIPKQSPFDAITSTPLFALEMQFSRDGRYLVAGGTDRILVQDMDIQTAAPIVNQTKFPPQPVFNPDASFIAYLDSPDGPRPVPQIYIVTRSGNQPRPLTAHTEGNISDLNWVNP